MEELFASMSGGTIFSKIDLKQAYLQLSVAEADREILTLSTHKGLFRCNRLMYSVAFAPAIWQRTIENILHGIPGVAVFLDDIRIAGKDKEQCLKLAKARRDAIRKRIIPINYILYYLILMYCKFVCMIWASRALAITKVDSANCCRVCLLPEKKTHIIHTIFGFSSTY